jgi:S1-C subfamily serine protease
VLAFIGAALPGGSAPRLVIDDDEFVGKVTSAAGKLLHEGKLQPMAALRAQVRTRSQPVSLSPISHQPLTPPDLCDRLSESTLAVGMYYKCPDCDGWHFNSSAGFVVSEGGIICTCCHVVLAEDKDIKESYMVAADATGRVFPVKAVLAADTESDTCFLKIEAAGLKPLPLRAGVRPGERIFCLSHPGGYFFMFTQGMVARLNRRQNDAMDEHGKTNGLLTRPILFLNVTAEFAPGSSGAPIVDEAGNVVGQVASIADAGEPPEDGDEDAPAWPSVPVRFCTATEEILRLSQAPAVLKTRGKARHRKADASEHQTVETLER